MNSGKKIAKMRNLIKLALFLVIILLLIYYFLSPAPISLHAYYVAGSGNDNNPGTEAKPWRTITKAADTLVAGETVYIKEGTYNEKITIKNSGSPGKYITFVAYPGQTVTIDGTGIVIPERDGLVRILGAGYVKLSGFRIINSRLTGITVTGDNGNNPPTDITIEKNYISNTASSAIFIEGGKDITIDGNEITKAQTMEGLSQQINETNNQTISLVNVDGFEIRNNKLYQNNFEGIGAKDGSSNGKIHRNDISQHQNAGIYMDAGSRASHDIEIFDNRIHDGRASGRGIAFTAGSGGNLKNVKIYNNVIYRNAATGIDISWYSKGTVDNISITDNTIYNNGLIDGWGGGISVYYNSATNVIIRNNIVSKNNHYSIQVKEAVVVIDHNLIDSYIGGEETKGSNYIEGDPQFVDTANGDFHLKSTSPAVDTGSSDSALAMDFDGNPRPTGAGYDIGAFEYMPTLISTSAPVLISPQTYYVATNGNDNNPGTEAQPWRTITKAADTLVAGETVYIKEGTYSEKITIKSSGSPGKYITFAAYPGQTVTIDGAGIIIPGWDGLVRILGASYIKLSGFRIINSRLMGIMTTGDDGNNFPTNIIIEKNYISNTASSAIFVEDGKDITIDGNEITKAQTHQDLPQNLIGQETISLLKVDRFEIKNNKLYNNNFESIDAKLGSSNGKIHHNDISQHESAGIYVDAWDGNSHDIEIFNNKVYDGRVSGRGIALAVENGGSLKNVKVYNNLVYNNAATGIDLAWYSKGAIGNISITSNTIYNNGLIDSWGGGISADYSSATNVIIRNNIVSKNNNYQIRILDTDAVIDRNLIDGYIGGEDETKGSNYIEGDPQFVDTANGDFHLKSTSPILDKGLSIGAPSEDFDGKSRPLGASYDIGAFEYSP